MANTINDLYLKYVNKVGKTLENDRYFRYLFEMVQAGSTTLQQNHKVLHKQVDERWLSVIDKAAFVICEKRLWDVGRAVLCLLDVDCRFS